MDFNKMFGKSLWTLKYTEYSLDFLKVILHITFPPLNKSQRRLFVIYFD